MSWARSCARRRSRSRWSSAAAVGSSTRCPPEPSCPGASTGPASSRWFMSPSASPGRSDHWGSTARSSMLMAAGYRGCDYRARPPRNRKQGDTPMTVPQSISHDLGVTGPLINGTWLERASLGAMDHINPSTARVNGTVMLSGPDEVDTAVAAAKAAFPEWRAMSPDRRRRILQRVEELVEAHVPELGRLTTLELGVPAPLAAALSKLTAGWFGYYAGWADKLE